MDRNHKEKSPPGLPWSLCFPCIDPKSDSRVCTVYIPYITYHPEMWIFVAAQDRSSVDEESEKKA